jgi:hypothetical protein
VTLELGRLFRVGQQISQVIPSGLLGRHVHRVVVGVHADSVHVATHGRVSEPPVRFEPDAPNSRFDIRELLPPNVGVISRRPWPRTTRALRYQVSLILESQVLDGAWCTSTDSDNQPAKVVHVFVPKWSAPLPHVLDLLHCYFPYEGAKIDYASVVHGDISRIITITRTEEPAA